MIDECATWSCTAIAAPEDTPETDVCWMSTPKAPKRGEEAARLGAGAGYATTNPNHVRRNSRPGAAAITIGAGYDRAITARKYPCIRSRPSQSYLRQLADAIRPSSPLPNLHRNARSPAPG